MQSIIRLACAIATMSKEAARPAGVRLVCLCVEPGISNCVAQKVRRPGNAMQARELKAKQGTKKLVDLSLEKCRWISTERSTQHNPQTASGACLMDHVV